MSTHSYHVHIEVLHQRQNGLKCINGLWITIMNITSHVFPCNNWSLTWMMGLYYNRQTNYNIPNKGIVNYVKHKLAQLDWVCLVGKKIVGMHTWHAREHCNIRIIYCSFTNECK